MSERTKLREFSEYLECRKGTSNKFYEIQAKEIDNGGGILTIRYGRIGTKGTKKEYRYESYGDASVMVDFKVETKLNKGYSRVSPLEALAGAVENPSDRKNRGRPPLDLSIPDFDTGNPATDKRLQDLCKTVLDKINLVRASYFELPPSIFRKQYNDVLAQYVKGYNRICDAESHKPYADKRSVEKVCYLFYEALVYGGYETTVTMRRFARSHWRWRH